VWLVVTDLPRPLLDPTLYPYRLAAVDPATLSPGVRNLVLALRERGIMTQDSGDGSNFAEGMSCALPYPHVAIVCPAETAEKVAEAAREVASRPGLIDWPFEITTSKFDLDGGERCLVMIEHVDAAAICERVGYKGYEPEDDWTGDDTWPLIVFGASDGSLFRLLGDVPDEFEEFDILDTVEYGVHPGEGLYAWVDEGSELDADGHEMWRGHWRPLTELELAALNGESASPDDGQDPR
jgi:hypothetical protein